MKFTDTKFFASHKLQVDSLDLKYFPEIYCEIELEVAWEVLQDLEEWDAMDEYDLLYEYVLCGSIDDLDNDSCDYDDDGSLTPTE